MKVGDTFSYQFRISDRIYRGFINLFEDENPLHTDDEFARAKGFKAKVMHGNILNGFISYFVGECLPTKNVIIHTQEIKYLMPVHLDDALKLSVSVKDVFESVSVVELGFTFSNEEGIKLAKGKITIGLLQ